MSQGRARSRARSRSSSTQSITRGGMPTSVPWKGSSGSAARSGLNIDGSQPSAIGRSARSPWAHRAEVDRDALLDRAREQLQRLAKPGAPFARQLELLAVVLERPLAGERRPHDLHVFARPCQRAGERHAVPALGHLRPGDPEPEAEPRRESASSVAAVMAVIAGDRPGICDRAGDQSRPARVRALRWPERTPHQPHASAAQTVSSPALVGLRALRRPALRGDQGHRRGRARCASAGILTPGPLTTAVRGTVCPALCPTPTASGREAGSSAASYGRARSRRGRPPVAGTIQVPTGGSYEKTILLPSGDHAASYRYGPGGLWTSRKPPPLMLLVYRP